jgi:5-methylcytosine-specific restriction enzyme subunit McrC
MGVPERRSIVLREHQPRDEVLDGEDVRYLQQHFAKVIGVRPTSTRGRWRLEPSAVVGTIVAPGVELRIQPKCGTRNLFAMLSHAHGLVKLRPELVHQAEDEDLREMLVLILVQHIEALVRSGLRRGYVEETACLGVLRGRLLLGEQLRTLPGRSTTLACQYQEHTADLPLNQVVAHALSQVGLTGSTDLDQRLRKLRRLFSGLTPRRFRPADFDQFLYDRLNAPYEVIHGICRLILEARGAEGGPGPLPMGSFLVNMDKLFQSFVAKWLDRHLPPSWRLEAQGKASLDQHGRFKILPDLLLYRGPDLRLVADTKYKLDRGKPARGDLYQALAYCRALGLRTAVLVYPDIDQPGAQLVLVDGSNELRTDGVDLARSWAMVEEGMQHLMHRLLALAA